jgi:cellulose biosynthesis protein BcsQ
MTEVILWANRKGGVGKTTLCVNVAAQVNRNILGDPGGITSRADRTPAVMVASIDPQHSTDFWARQVESKGRETPFHYASVEDPALIPALRTLGHDYAFIDSAGNLEEPLLHVALTECDRVFIPMDCTALSIEPTIDTVEVVTKAGKPFVIVLNNWTPGDPTEAQYFAELARAQGWPLASKTVRHYKLHARGALEGKTVLDYKENVIANRAKEDIIRLCSALGLGAGTNGKAL